MRIYIAASLDRRYEMAPVAARLRLAGHIVTSSWLTPRDESLPEIVRALIDVEDLAAADCLVLFTEGPTPLVSSEGLGGRQVEFGYALAAGMRLCVVGSRANVFHYLPRVEVFASTAELIAALACQSTGRQPVAKP